MSNPNDKTDYNKDYMDLLKYLPEPYQSDVNDSIFNNLFNRFLTKQEIEKVSGYIGRGNTNAITSRQIHENDVHRQAYQLQPIVYDKIGTVEHMASWDNIQTELTRHGVDFKDYADWGAVESFNWVPPVDINKIINYRDYYWVDPNRSAPEYITIRSRCAVATSRATFWSDIVKQHGDTFPIKDILKDTNVDSLTHAIEDIDSIAGNIKVSGDVRDVLTREDYFDITNTIYNNGTYQITNTPTYDGVNNTTSLDVSGLVADEANGVLTLRRFNRLVFGPNTTVPSGDYGSLFETDFVFFTRSTSNPELDNRFVKVVESVVDVTKSQTTVTIDFFLTDNTYTDSVGSLSEQESLYIEEQNCQCGLGTVGFGDTLWDDNPDTPLWGDAEGALGSPGSDGISDHTNLLDRITNPVPPTSIGLDNQLWYDTSGDILYQYSTALGWKVIWNSFSVLLAATDGFAIWDQSPECDTAVRIEATDQWINENKWFHKNDITNFAGTTRASQPIIEYDWDLELNEWTFVDYKWSYRAEILNTFVDTDINPAVIELEPITWWEVDASDVTNKTIILDTRYGNQTTWFTPDTLIDIGGDVYEIEYSEYKSEPITFPYRTYLILKNGVSTTGGNLNGLIPSTNMIIPTKTSMGDEWTGYGVHWLFLGAKNTVPLPHQIKNPYLAVDTTTSSVIEYDHEYRTSLFAQQYRILVASIADLLLTDVIEPNDTRSLRRKALFGFDDIRVYFSDVNNQQTIRSFGTYDEIGEAVIDVIGIDGTDEFILGGDYGQYFSPGVVIRLQDNTTIGTQDYTVSTTPPSAPNRIRISSTLTGISPTGNISNVSRPLSTLEYPTVDFISDNNVTMYVMGIHFTPPLIGGVNVTIEVGEGALNELGLYSSNVRTIEDEAQYKIAGDVTISRIKYRLVEQIKNTRNQYPLFDIFTVDGAPAYKASPIFGYKTSPDAPINQTGERIVYDSTSDIYTFDQFILDSDNSELFAYRDYSNKQTSYWFNPETNELRFWHGISWDERTEVSNHFRKAVISNIEPTPHELTMDGLYWYNTELDKLFVREINPTTFVGTWIEITQFDTSTADVSLQTIWKRATNGEKYVPDKVDWIRRSLLEYNTEKSIFVDARVVSLLLEDSSLTEQEAIVIATKEWYSSQSNHLSPTGVWVGDWEIPAPLYHNNLHENKKFLTSRELITHFTTIIDAQPKIPGYNGTKSAMFNITASQNVNYGIGGTIKEFNDGFDMLISSTFVNNVTPRSLITFAHDQYESLLNSLKDIYRKNASTLLVNVDIDNILNLSKFISDEVINNYELNDQAAFIYGDTTTFTDVDGINDIGVRNWIATLPYLGLVDKHLPERNVSTQGDLDEIVHHDGHRNSYVLSQTIIDIISQLTVRSPDPRNTSNTIGETSVDTPPNTETEFVAKFGTPITNREGVYWYHTPTTNISVLYRYIVAESGNVMPAAYYPDGTLWFDTNVGAAVLRVKSTDYQGNTVWDVVDGLSIGDGRLHNGTDPTDISTSTISAWQPIDLSVLLSDTIFELETRLYNNVPDTSTLRYDFANTKSINPVSYNKYLEEAFLDHVSQAGILTPYENKVFDITDAFTWNYTRSAQGGGFAILEADGLTNSFLVSGDALYFFDLCASTSAPPLYPNCTTAGTNTSFYIKNSNENDGVWTTILSKPDNYAAFYDLATNTTRVFVQGDVLDSTTGIIYAANLPSQQSTSFPNNINIGSESGGEWRDLYTNVYGTPYPNLEPWVLQGYDSKPTWWEAAYRNDNPDKWGTRTWKYKHGFDITGIKNNNIDPATGQTYGTFDIKGDFNEVFISGHQFNIIDDIGNPTNNGTYVVDTRSDIATVNYGAPGFASIIIADPLNRAYNTYKQGMVFAIVQVPATPATDNVIFKTYTIRSVNHSGNIFTIAVEEEILTTDILTNSFISGALYNPQLNTTSIKIHSLAPNTIPGGRILTAIGYGHGMWENIRTGVIPPNSVYPNGIIGVTGIPSKDKTNGLSVPELPKFNYFSVNIDNNPVSNDNGVNTYNPDEVLPPYWDNTLVFTTTPIPIDSTIRTLFNDFTTEIVSPQAAYVFGDSGTVEWEWKASSQYLYDQLTIAYRIDPVRYISSTFGFNRADIGTLQINRNDKNTISHNRINFHGDIVDNKQYKSYGVNQWYVNYNRHAGYDANFSDFRELWTGWTAPLTYQFSSFIDTPSLKIAHRNVDVTSFDYNVTSKRVPGESDIWLDAFKINILNMPYNTSRYNNELDWRFEINTNAKLSRNIKYYDVHNYQFHINATNNQCILYTWTIESIDTANKIFTIKGDQTYIFVTGRQFSITDSIGNNGTYTVASSSFDTTTKTTKVLVENAIPLPNTSGLITADYRSIPWVTGDGIYLSTSDTLPIPLSGDNINGLVKYFIIKLSDNTFALAETLQDAQEGQAIDVSSTGRGDHFIGEIDNTFKSNDGLRTNINWRWYAVDKNNILEFNTPYEIQGMQKLVDTVHGYDAYLTDNGWAFNIDSSLLDPITAQPVNWQLEVKRFVSYAYTQRVMRESFTDKYAVTVDANTNTWDFEDADTSFITGEPFVLFSSNEVYPVPLSKGVQYYMIRDTINTFRIAASRRDAENDVEIDVISTAGIGDLRIAVPKNYRTVVPSFEINPFRNAIWVNTPTGILSNTITGPVEDIRTGQSIFNQNGERINEDQLRVYRNDLQTKIYVADAVNNDSEGTALIPTPYTNLHIGGLHLFTDAYEHVLVLNNYNTNGALLYDPFIGLNVTKYEMLFNKQPVFTQRPNVGGYIIETFFNQGANITENLESSVENLRYAYDTYDTLESNLMTEYSRKALGYEGTTDYLSNLNLSRKSQFLFWRGQIQNKGSINAITAFTNSRRFVDAKLDDFWAVKLGSFGSMKEREYPELYVTTEDARTNELRLEFIQNDVDESTVDATFTPIKSADHVRWYNQPDQIELLRNNNNVLYFDMKPIRKRATNDVDNPLVITGNASVGKLFIEHQLEADDVIVTQYDVVLKTTNVLSEYIDYNIINGNVIELIGQTINPDDVEGYGLLLFGAESFGLYSFENIPITNPITIWGMVFDNDSQSPANLIDKSNNITVSPIQYWDPLRGAHYSAAIHNVDMQNDVDPAQYNNTPRIVSNTLLSANEFVGTTWLNTYDLNYTPYYNDKTVPDPAERFSRWGRISDWAKSEVFEWVESDVPPNEWDILAAREEGDRTILEHLRKAGIAKKTLFENNPNNPTEWIHAKNRFIDKYVAIDGVLVADVYNFNFTIGKGNDLDYLLPDATFRYIVNVYINGKIFESNVDITDGYNIAVSAVSLSDILNFVQLIPTDQAAIDVKVADGTMLQEYEYTQVSEYDDFGNIFYKYYFWVLNKGTKPANRNRTMSALAAQQQLVSMPAAHMFFQKNKPAEQQTETIEVPRSELFPVTPFYASTKTFSTTLDIVFNEPILVEVNGVDIPDVDYVLDTANSTITIVNPTLVVGDEVRITYIGIHPLHNKESLPHRYTQTIIRGLQGVVNADRRYTIKFTRDFTLRDELNPTNELITAIELKDLHEEWKIFRREQQHNIDRWMWDKITESIVGYKLTDSSIRVPSYERELYDVQHGTDTQYGMGTGQAFVNGDLALRSIIAYLSDPDVDFSPIDIDVFFSINNFNTSESIIKSMDYIYNAFTYTNVNRIYFSVLHDAFTTKAEHPDIFKTSMVSLHGIQPFQTSGFFDD